MSNNFIKIFDDGTSEATLVQPAYGLYDKVNADDNRDVYINGQWHPTSGGELVTNGTFDVDLAGWESYDVARGTLSWSNGMAKLDNTTGTGNMYLVSPIVDISIGNTIEFDAIADGTTPAIYFVTKSTKTLISNLIRLTNISGTRWKFTISDTYVGADAFIINAGVALTTLAYFDNISVFKSQPTLGTPYVPQFTYLSKDGKLAEVETVDGVPVDVHYDKLAPDLVRHTIQATDIVSEDIEVTGEYRGKNACTAWVNFDGTTTPPTIRDSFNVSSVVRISTGVYEVRFDKPMSDVNYLLTGTSKFNKTNAAADAVGSYGSNTVSYARISNVYASASASGLYDRPYINITIFGGK